ncbi:MAG: phospho-sugar mutase [Firmicutes bacterium]|nr:phospho-sugar mutase [Bacillota bacterium]
MKMRQWMAQYDLWLNKATEDCDIAAELKQMAGNETLIADAFYRNLEFGTGGLRGVMGAGSNRMNLYTVAKASQGLANYITAAFARSARAVAIGYDSRVKSDWFAEVAAGVFAANGITVFIFNELMPTPCLSFAVRQLHCAAGIMITASHNPAAYNGYKVYGRDGCQITTDAAAQILTEIERLDIFADVKRCSYTEGIQQRLINGIPDTLYTAYVEAVKGQSMLSADVRADKNAAIVYTPLHGAGLKPVLRTLRESGYTRVAVVREQEQPDGAFPTCPCPNPELRETLALGIDYARANHAGLLLATDPDCDRVGVAVGNGEEYTVLTGHETGMLLLDYICARHQARGTMPANPVMIKTVVTADMAERIAANYGVKTINVLTGFKFIGEQIGLLEQAGRVRDFIFGFEESCGYLSGPYVRDKDGVNGALLICEMFAFYQAQNISLLEKLEELYRAYGYCLHTLYSYAFDGADGFIKMQQIMQGLRNGVKSFDSLQVLQCLDYAQGLDGLPRSDMLKFILENNCSLVVRPSGTEPKLKIYSSIRAHNRENASLLDMVLGRALREYMTDVTGAS